MATVYVERRVPVHYTPPISDDCPTCGNTMYHNSCDEYDWWYCTDCFPTCPKCDCYYGPEIKFKDRNDRKGVPVCVICGYVFKNL